MDADKGKKKNIRRKKKFWGIKNQNRLIYIHLFIRKSLTTFRNAGSTKKK